MSSHKSFSSRWAFIIACVGSAVGMANVWGFPYKMGENGGGAFLLIYIFFVVIFSFCGLAAEYAIGRRAKTGTLGAYELAWRSRAEKFAEILKAKNLESKNGKNFKNSQNGEISPSDKTAKISQNTKILKFLENFSRIFGKFIGWLPLAGSICIAIGYAVIIAYVFKALFQALAGSLMSVDTATWFESFALSDYSVVWYHFIIVVGTLLTLFFGAKSIEKTNKIMMPLFFILFFILAIHVFFLDGAFNGYKFMFSADWGKLADPMVWVSAMGQAFFSLSVTGSGMIVYGAYLAKSEDIVDSAKKTALFDTIAAVTAALVMIPAVFAYSMDPAGGPGLLFVTLPKILQDMPGGQIFAIILFTAVIFGGITSLQNMFEAVAESVMHKFPRISRTAMLVILCVLSFGIGVNMEAISSWGPWMDFVSIYIIPIGAVIGAISWFWVMPKEELLDEINTGSAKIYGKIWHFTGKFIFVPLAITLCIIALSMNIAF